MTPSAMGGSRGCCRGREPFDPVARPAPARPLPQARNPAPASASETAWDPWRLAASGRKRLASPAQRLILAPAWSRRQRRQCSPGPRSGCLHGGRDSDLDGVGLETRLLQGPERRGGGRVRRMGGGRGRQRRVGFPMDEAKGHGSGTLRKGVGGGFGRVLRCFGIKQLRGRFRFVLRLRFLRNQLILKGFSGSLAARPQICAFSSMPRVARRAWRSWDSRRARNWGRRERSTRDCWAWAMRSRVEDRAPAARVGAWMSISRSRVRLSTAPLRSATQGSAHGRDEDRIRRFQESRVKWASRRILA